MKEIRLPNLSAVILPYNWQSYSRMFSWEIEHFVFRLLVQRMKNLISNCPGYGPGVRSSGDACRICFLKQCVASFYGKTGEKLNFARVINFTAHSGI